MKRFEVKKHITQMSMYEIQIIKTKLDNSYKRKQKVRFAKHCNERWKEKVRYDVNFKTSLMKTLHEYEIIEYKNVYFSKNSMEERVVLRSKQPYYGKNICLVYSITNKVIITVWLNGVVNNHKALRLSEYNADMEIK